MRGFTWLRPVLGFTGLRPVFGLMCLLLMTASCERLPLHDEEGKLRLDIAIDYNIKNMANLPEPELMYVGFYDKQTGQLRHTDYTGPRGGEITVPAARYNMLVYNFDTEATLVRNSHDIFKAEAYTNYVATHVARNYKATLQKIKEFEARTTRVQTYEDQPLINEPDHLFASHTADVNVPVRVADDQIFVIHTDASSLVQTYSLSIGPIKGLDYVSTVEVFITGQVQSRLISTREITGVPSTIYFPIEMATRKVRSDMLTTTFNTFGKYPEAENKVVLVVKLIDFEGNVTVLETDVTDQFDDPENTDDEIEIDQEIEILPPTGGSGFAPAVTIWEDLYMNIEI